MKILTSAKAIRHALRNLRPSRIAVAYVGRDWRSFISAKCLEEIVLSPTLGTNPKAVRDIMEELGHEHVHFLEELHAKFYIGDGAALLGSCNLSAHAIDEGGLLEAAVEVRGDDVLRLTEQFYLYTLAAQRRYPTLKAKMNQLRKLGTETNRAYSRGFLAPVKAVSPVTTYQSGLDRIHVMVLDEPEGEPVREKIAKQAPELLRVDFDDYFDDWLQLEAIDDARPNDWFLCCWCTDTRRLDKRVKPWWIYAHYVVEHGMTSKGWPTFVGEVNGEDCRPPPVPFDLDSSTSAAIKEVLQTGRFPQFFPAHNGRLPLAEADKVTPAFLDAIKRQVTNRTRALPSHRRP